jgi:hypothetical protein
MTKGFIDGATITSALTYLNQGKSASTSLWHEISILETTYLLLHEDIHIVPRPKGLGNEHGDYAIVANEFSALIADSEKRKQVFKETFDLVNNEALDPTHDIHKLVKSAWERINQDEDFLKWADLQRFDRWANQSQTYGALYDEQSIALISKVSGYDMKDVKRVYRDSGDVAKVKRWRKRTESWENARIANAAWVIGGFIRGLFYDNLAAAERLHLLTHPFRQHAAVPSNSIEQYDISNSLEVLAKLIIANALNEVTKERRIRTWVESVKEAREFIKTNVQEYPKLIDATTRPNAEKNAITVARGINLEGNIKELRYLIDASLSLALWGFGVAPWASIPFMFLFKMASNKTPGTYLGDFVFQSDYYYQWLARSVPGRVERTLPKE